MIETIEGMLRDLKRGRLTRRQFAVSLAALTTGMLAIPGALAASPEPTGFPAISLNHVTVKVPDLHRTSRFYQEFFGMPLRQQSATTHILGVGKSFFGIEQGDGQPATVNHYDFGIANFNADAMRARLSELHLKFSDATSKESFKFYDQDGFQVQVNGPDYVGHVS
jgi:catechol 2,3-dioxygenase-like lactoylglutathione lyase family enzyme